MRFRTVLLAAVSLACAAAPVAAATSKTTAKAHHKAPAKHRIVKAVPRGISVRLDEVRIVTFNRPVSTVFVGNPVVADATVIDQHHVFILGKGFGTTNMIALGPQSEPVANQQLTVLNPGGLVTVNKGAAQFSYSCNGGRCAASPVPGDQKAFFDENTSTTASHQQQGMTAAVASTSH
jgi:Flp pilus assembly secretin CpaC